MRVLVLFATLLSYVCGAPHDLDIRVGYFHGGVVSRHSFQSQEAATGPVDATPLLRYLGVPHITYHAENLTQYGLTLHDRPISTTSDRNRATVTIPNEILPFSSTYWPMVDGGIDARWSSPSEPSPLEKYCSLYLNAQQTNRSREWVKKNQGPDVPNVASWFGICQGWAGAGVAERSPLRDIWVRSIRRTGNFAASQQYLTVECSPQQVTNGTYGCIKLYTGDITGLISESYASSTSIFIGQRCDIAQSEFDVDGLGRPQGRTQKCRSNPATLYLVATNFIGRSQHGFVINCVNNDEVWNQPVYSYRMLLYRNITFSQGLTLVTRELTDAQVNTTIPSSQIINLRNRIFNASTWNFNRAAIQLVHVQLELIWAVETSLPPKGKPTLQPASGRYEFILELNALGNVIGGEWIDRSKKDHPPFYWVPIEPAKDNDAGIPPNFYYGNVKQILTISQSPTPTWGSTINVTSSTNYPDPCNQYFTCSSCITANACGWCQTTGKCQTGNAIRSNDGVCNRTVTGGSWQWQASHCSAMTPAPVVRTPAPTPKPCGAFIDCLSCVTGDTCGWCAVTGRCQDGQSTASDDGICTRTALTWGWTEAQCSTLRRPTTRPPTSTPTPVPTAAPPTPSPTPRPTSAPAANPCAGFTTCQSCVTGSTCGWCAVSGRCQDGQSAASNDGVCTRTASTWGWLASQCSTIRVPTPTPTQAPATETPTTQAPVTDAPTTEAPVTEAPATEAPTTEAPTTEAPTTEAPTTEAPATEVPTTAAPVTEAPATDAPATDLPTTEAAATEAPVLATESPEI